MNETRQARLDTFLATRPSVPNDVDEIGFGKDGARPARVEFYGRFGGHQFTRDDMNPRGVKRVVCIHDAPHSVHLFLQEKDRCDIAIHNYIPFVFPGADQYVIDYTQRYEYPLVITRYGVPVETLLERNGMHKVMARWCTRIYKIEVPRGIYKHYGLASIVQVKGMTRHQSARRSKLDPSMTVDPMSQKSFPIYQELPIFESTEEEQLVAMAAAGIDVFEPIQRLGYHGCMLCPYRDEEYYNRLAREEPAWYAQCHAWREAGSKRPRKDGSVQPYYYHRKSQVM